MAAKKTASAAPVASGINFIQEIVKDIKSTGSWKGDYTQICSQNKVTPVTTFHESTNEHGTILRVQNTALDIMSWRAAMLAISMVDGACEIALYNVSVTPTHVVELGILLQKIGLVGVLRLEYISWINDTENPNLTPLEALKSLLNSQGGAEYISFRGCKFGDEFVCELVTALEGNYLVKALNLSDNLITDVAAIQLSRVIRMHPSLKNISLAYNHLSNTVLEVVQQLLVGTECTQEEDAFIKKQVKAVIEKNKAISKAKAAKKGGTGGGNKLPARKGEQAQDTNVITEISTAEPIVVFRDHNYIVNKHLSTIDLSHNPFLSEEAVLTLLRGLRQDSALLSAMCAGRATEVTIFARGLSKGTIGAEHSPDVDLVNGLVKCIYV